VCVIKQNHIHTNNSFMNKILVMQNLVRKLYKQ